MKFCNLNSTNLEEMRERLFQFRNDYKLQNSIDDQYVRVQHPPPSRAFFGGFFKDFFLILGELEKCSESFGCLK